MKRIMIMIMIMLFLSHAALYAQVGINTTSPNAQLDILASNPATPSNTDGILIPRVASFPSTNPTADQQGMLVFLTTTVGVRTPGFYHWDFPTLSWVTIDSNKNWKITGNSGTNTDEHFIGTTDLTALRFRVNNINAGKIESIQSPNSSGNVALGVFTMQNNTVGSYNVALGLNALRENTTGSDNVAIGNSALGENTFGGGNLAIGTEALKFNRTGNFNIALGYDSMHRNTTGSNNVGIGFSNLYWNSGESQYNIAHGYRNLYMNEGDNNIGMGFSNLRNNGIGSNNIAIGKENLVSNDTGDNNIGLGVEALYDNRDGNNNIGIGYRALRHNTSTNNIAVGADALRLIANGVNNTAMGIGAGLNLTAGVNNAITLGYNSGFATTVSNHVNIGNASTQWIGGQVAWGTYSDERIKDNIKEDVPGLAFIKALRPVTYNLNIKRQHEIANLGKADESGEWKEKYDIEKDRQTGFLAQEVAAAAQRLNYDFNGVYTPKEGKGLYAISYSSFVMPLIKAVQEQDAEIQQLKQQLKKYENLETRLKQLEERILNNKTNYNCS
jgi:hypothetical protein